jgi:hypothetical protein
MFNLSSEDHGLTGAFGVRISRHTTPGDLRHPTLFAIWIVSAPAITTPTRPMTI